jgi:hypothetical protein
MNNPPNPQRLSEPFTPNYPLKQASSNESSLSSDGSNMTP